MNDSYYYYASESTLQDINQNLVELNTNVSNFYSSSFKIFVLIAFSLVLFLVIRFSKTLLNLRG